MLFDEPVALIGGLTIYRDFDDPKTYYYLPPESPRIARSAEGGDDGDYALRLVLWRRDLETGAAPQGLADEGGFLNLDTDLHVSKSQLTKVEEEVRRRFGDVNLVPVPFTQGSVELVLLGQSRADENKPFVRKIAGSAVPSLYGTERAAFSTVLDREGAALMRSVIERGGATMALAQYHLTYVGIAPAYNLKITIDYARVSSHFDLKIGASVRGGNGKSAMVGKAGFHMLMEELKESRAIKVEETSYVPGEAGKSTTNQELINDIIGKLMGSTWFKPTLAAPSETVAVSTPELPPAPTNPTTPTTPTPTTPGPTTSAERKNAELKVTSREPTPLPEGLDVKHTPAATGIKETLDISGEGAVVKIDDKIVPVANGKVQTDVAVGATLALEVSWPAVTEQTEKYHLYFNYDHPHDQPAEVESYRTGTPNPADSRFSNDSRVPGPAAPLHSGPGGLKAWAGTLKSKRVTLNAYASYEGHDDSDHVKSNMALSERRLAVARALLGTLIDPASPGQAFGQSKYKELGGAERENVEHRVVHIQGTKAAGRAAAVLKGTLSRPAGNGGGTTPGGTTPGGTTPGGTTPGGTTPGGSGSSTSVQAAFEINLEMIEREEKITAVYELNTRQARTREVHPAGQLVLDVVPADLPKYLLEADLAIDFFQRIALKATTTAQWDQDGVDTIRVEVRYGPRADGDFHKRKELVLTKDGPVASWETHALRVDDRTTSPLVLWYDYRVTVHFKPDVSLGEQAGEATSVGVPGADAEGWIRTYARNLVINPRDVTTIFPVHVAAGLLRFDLVTRADVTVSYGPYRQTLTLDREHTSHHFVVRPEAGLVNPVLSTEGTLFFADGARVPLPRQEWAQQQPVIINEPRDNVLRVAVFLADPNREIERAEVKLKYEDGDYLVEATRTLAQHAQGEEWAVRLEDATHRAWSYEAVLVKRGGAIQSTGWRPGPPEDRLILGVQAVDVIPLDVNWLIPLPTPEVLAAKVDIEYVDAANDVRWAHSELVRQGHSGNFKWSIPIKDRDRRAYRYRVTQYGPQGQVREQPWAESESLILVLMPV